MDTQVDSSLKQEPVVDNDDTDQVQSQDVVQTEDDQLKELDDVVDETKELSKDHSKYPEDWFTEEAQLTYIADCIRCKVIPSGYYIRRINEETMRMRHCVLGTLRTKPICNSLGFSSTIKSLDLTDACLNDKFITNLLNLFKTNTVITELNLSNNQLTSKCAENLCDVLASSAQLERIDLHGNCFDDRSSTYFAELMSTSLAMSYLNLSYNQFAEIASVQFGRSLPQATSLIELDVSWNRLGTGGMRQLAKGLADNKNIKIVNFSFNGLGPRNGCPQLALTFKKNKILEVLDLSGNRLSPEGAVILSKGMLKNTTLRKLYGILVNQDFRDLQDDARLKLPELVVRAGKWTTEKTRVLSPKFLDPEQSSPKAILIKMGRITGYTLAELLRPLDPAGDKLVTRQAFVRVLYVSASVPLLIPDNK